MSIHLHRNMYDKIIHLQFVYPDSYYKSPFIQNIITTLKMDQLITQQLKNHSYYDILLPNYRRFDVPKQQRHTSFSQLSNWTNSDKLTAEKLPNIYSRYELKKIKTDEMRLLESNTAFICPIKQMDLHLKPVNQMQSSFYCKYLRTKLKNPLKQVEFVTNYQKDKKGRSLLKQSVGVGKLQQLITRQKSNRYNVNIEDYLRTTKLFKDLTARKY